MLLSATTPILSLILFERQLLTVDCEPLSTTSVVNSEPNQKQPPHQSCFFTYN